MAPITNRPDTYGYHGTVTRIIDGDTIDALVRYDVGFDRTIEWTQRLRLARINAPETRGVERPEGLLAKAWLIDHIPEGTEIWFESHKDDAWGRYIADIFTSLDCINDALVDAGHAEYQVY